MSFLPFFVLTEGAAVAALLTRRSRVPSMAIGLGGLVVALVAAVLMSPGESLVIGDVAVVTTAYQRLFLVLGALGGLLICVVGLATTSQRNVPAALLASLGWSGLALALPDPTAAVLATACAGLAGILVILAPAAGPGVDVSARELRAVAVATALAVAGIAVVAGPASDGAAASEAPLVAAAALDPAVLGIAYLAVVLAVALRFGVIPFHGWAGRLSQAAPEAALPLLLAWGPAALAVVALAWIDGSIAPVAPPLDVERGLVAGVAILTLVLGTFAVWIQDDVEHVVGYSIAQDAGFIILALTVLGPAAWVPAREWVLVFAVAKTALAGWALALRASHGTRRIDDLAGWALRSPVLGLAFLAIVVATIGWPGSMAWEARSELVRLALAGPIGTLVFLGAATSLAYYARIGAVGLRRTAGAGPDATALLRWPARLGAGRGPRGDQPERRGGQEPEGGPEPVGGQEPAVVADRVPGAVSAARARAAAGGIVGGWRTSRLPVATLVVALLAAVALATSLGGFGVPEAARGAAPSAPASLPSFAPVSPAPSGPTDQLGSPEASTPPEESNPPEESTPPSAPESSGSTTP